MSVILGLACTTITAPNPQFPLGSTTLLVQCLMPSGYLGIHAYQALIPRLIRTVWKGMTFLPVSAFRLSAEAANCPSQCKLVFIPSDKG